MKYILAYFFLSIGTIICAAETDTTYYEFWNIDSLTNIGGYSVTTYGEPKVIVTDSGKTIEFDGVDDAIIVDNNPFGDTKEFTFEVLFKPYSGEPNITNEPRFVCFWDPNDAKGPRMTIEVRVTNTNQWYFDGFLKTDTEQLTLIDATKTHPTDQWTHAAVTYKNNVFTTYVNGQKELSGTVGYTSKVFNTTGKTSVGARYSLEKWFNGTIKSIKVTHKALTPAEFFISDTTIADTNSTDTTTTTSIIQDFPGNNSPEIYPVPAKNELYITNSAENVLPVSTFITSTSGELVYQSSQEYVYSENTQILDIASLQNGIYYVGLQYQNYFITRKICVLH